jgi:Histidine kinase-, DNA gyrase B-, and HSP90-like ATPase
MRRHAEGLIILAGSTPARGWRDPVPVVDVLRAAIAEVEDYMRIDVLSESRDSIVGAAVNDVIHLIAELAENATSFSPPTTHVEIKADGVANGLAVEIEDRGLGLSDSEMAAINQRLASPPEFDLANSEQLGLFVVGQLAARHGIRVSLRSSPYGGTIAIVLMPRSIVVREGESGPAEPAALGGGRPLAVAAPFEAPPAPVAPAILEAPEPPLPERVRGVSQPAAPVFSLTGRHRLAAADLAAADLAAEAGAPAAAGIPADPWQSFTAASPAGGTGTSPRFAGPSGSSGPFGPPAPSGPPARPATAPWEQPAWDQAAWDPGQWDQPAETGTGSFPAAPATAGDDFRAAPEPAAADLAAGETHLGMPVRVRQASLAPQLRGGPRAPGGGPAPGGPPVRSPEQARNLMAALQRGWEHGRTDDLDDAPGDQGDWPGGGGQGTAPGEGEGY